MAGTGDNTGSNGRSRSGIPVVSRSGGHGSSGVSDAGFTLCVKVFHFLDARPPPPLPHPTPPLTRHDRGHPDRGHPERSSRRGHPERSSREVIQERSSREVIQERSSREVIHQKSHTQSLYFVFILCHKSHRLHIG
jgi:hypothetical protein